MCISICQWPVPRMCVSAVASELDHYIRAWEEGDRAIHVLVVNTSTVWQSSEMSDYKQVTSFSGVVISRMSLTASDIHIMYIQTELPIAV